MKRIFSYLPKKVLFAIATVAAIAGIAVGVQAGFGPDRPTYTMAVPADHITFNSITDNPVAGDERAFLKGAIDGAAGFTDPVTGATDGQEITLQMYVHNNAASNLNLKALNTTVRVALPTTGSRTQTVTGYISADNATPGTVSDTLDLTGANNGSFELEYIPGSAEFTNNVFKNGTPLADSIVTTGALVGYDKMDGVIPGCTEYSGWVTLKVKVKMPNYAVQKSVRLKGEGADKWRESANVKIGDTVQWLVKVSNIGNTDLKNIIVLDQLPPYMSVVPGTVKLIDGGAYTDTNPYIYPNSAIQEKDGKVYVNVNSGDYAPGSIAYVMFDAVVKDDKAIECGNQLLYNIAYATPEGLGAVSDTAQVIVVNEQPCEQPTKPVYSCDELNVTTIGGREIEAQVKTTALNGATLNNITYSFGNGSQNLVTDKSTVNYTYASDGTYTIKAVPSFTVDGKTVTATSDNCVKTVSFQSNTPVTPPSVLPNTGGGSAGTLIGLFAGSTAIGTLGYRFWAIRRLGR